MEDPIKIIHKYKNSNRRVQYHIHIFLGDIIDEKCMRILRKIKQMDLYTSLISIDENEQTIIQNNYGEYWYEKFFNSYHINNTKELTLKNPARMKELRSIYNNKWITDHFTNYLKRLETMTYSYEYMIKEERERKSIKKVMQQQQQHHEADAIINYTLSDKTMLPEDTDEDEDEEQEQLEPTNSTEPSHIMAPKYNIKGSQDKPYQIISDNVPDKDWCDEDTASASESEDTDVFGSESDSDSDADIADVEESNNVYLVGKIKDMVGGAGAGADDEENETSEVVNSEFDFENMAYNDEIASFESEVEKDLENVDLIFSDIDEADKNIKLTTREIKEAISNEAYEKLNKKISDFDSKKDNNMFDENLKDVYHKNYITHQYIYKDDTIKVIHNKICCGFKNDNKFGDNTYIIPSYQYLWSEYYYKDKMEKIMIGQKWIVKNDLLKLDIEPSNIIGVYEDLRGKLKLLRDNIRRQGKIKREDDDNNILFDYEGFYTYNELYMIDIYNEFGQNYDPNFEELKNLVDIYLRIYFPKIRLDDIKNIIDFLKTSTADNKKIAERNKLKLIFETANHDLILENEIMRDIELIKKKNKDYVNYFQENFVTQSVIRSYLLDRYKKIDLFRIFDNFTLDENYPFIQFQPTDGVPRYRYNEKYLIENERKEIIMKWFENSPYGISFKIKVNDKSEYKYMAINLNENGKIDYKIQWKEEDMSTVDDIQYTYVYIQNLIKKINAENEKFNIKLNVPTEKQFHYAFINTIQKFELPNNFSINHNDLSEFARYFFPYIALVIEPRKRQSKIKKGDANEKSKFGTYLRYKRVSKYENKIKIEHRIVFFMRNYEYNDQSLANEISKEFNITEEQAYVEIQSVREKYLTIKKSRKILKKMENIPKYKPPGIGIDIQGKSRNKYKMRIAGARDREQLDRILIFMNVLLYLYVETYLYKRPDRQRMKDRLKRLTKIAHRRNKVDEIVDHETSNKTVKQMTSIDKKRLSYKADENQYQWTRYCQNSGKDKRRRPQQLLSAEELVKLGYVWREKIGDMPFGHYERKISVDTKGKTKSKKSKKEITLRAIQLPLDDTGENFVYYTCSPEDNGKHMYVGFLNKSKNPDGDAMPCCFIKDHLLSKNKEKRNFFLKSIGIMQENEEENKISGDQLYILQDSNKIQEGRFAFLPKYMDIFMNHMLGNVRLIKNHYLLSTPTGYYFKYGTRQDKYKYINTLCSVFDLTVEEFKNKLIRALELDRNQIIFTSLNNGDIRTQFGTIDAYIKYIKNNEYLEFPLLNDLICIPGVIKKNGINVIIFQKKLQVIKKNLEREKVKESYYVICQNSENIAELKNPERETVFIIKENKNYYPIIMVIKDDEESKELNIIKTFKYEPNPKNMITHVFKYYKINCQSEYHILVKDDTTGNMTAKETYKILVGLNKKEYLPKTQIIDARFKCKYIITNSGNIIPTLHSGTNYNVNITTNIDTYIKDYNTTFKYLNDINDLSKAVLKIKPIGIFYKDKKEKSYVISAIMTENYNAVPVIERYMTIEYVKKEKLLVQHKPSDELIDIEIMKGRNNIVIDKRIYYVSKNNYETEMYQLFRYHLSYYLNSVPIGIKYKERLEKIMAKNDSKKDKKLEIKRLLYKMTSSDLAKTFNELLKTIQTATTQKGGNDDDENEESILVIPRDFDVTDKRPRSNLRDTVNTAEVVEFDFSESVPEIPAYGFVKNEPKNIVASNFPPEEKIWIHIIPDNKKINYPSFKINNNRELCYNNVNREACNIMQHCNWNNSRNMCLLSIKKDLLIDYINKVTEEFVLNEFQAHEILRKGEYFVSDIVNYNIFTERPGERVVMSSNTNINKILSEIFGKDNIPRIGKRRNKMDTVQNANQLNAANPIKEIDNWYVQNIIPNNNTIYRAFANAQFWLLHPYNENVARNLGYYSIPQTQLSNIYKSQVIDWLLSKDNSFTEIEPYIKQGDIVEFATMLSNTVDTITSCIVESYVLSRINDTVIYIYDDNNNIIYAMHPYDGFIYDYKKTPKPFDPTKYRKFKKIIQLRFFYFTKSTIPNNIEAIYPTK